MQRSAEQIKAKMKEYRENPEAMVAMTDMLLYMGISDASELYKEAVKELEEEKTAISTVKLAYINHLKKGSRHYMSFDKFVQKWEAGEIEKP